MNKKQVIGAKIKERRRSLFLTQTALALTIGVRPEQVYLWESGRYMPSIENRGELLKALKIKSANFFKGV